MNLINKDLEKNVKARKIAAGVFLSRDSFKESHSDRMFTILLNGKEYLYANEDLRNTDYKQVLDYFNPPVDKVK